MMLGWMFVFLVVGIVIGSLVMSSCIHDYVKGEPAEFGKNRTLRFSGHP